MVFRREFQEPLRRVFVRSIGRLLVRDRNKLLACADRRKRSLDGEHAVLAQRRLDTLGVGSLRQ